MAANSKIQWTTHTFNPWRGCSKVHTGCANCYAEATSKRNETILGTWGPNGTRVVAAECAWAEVLKWNKAAAKLSERPRVFCASLADVFEDWSGPVLDHFGGEHYTSDSNPSKILNSDDAIRIGYQFNIDDYHITTIADVRRRLFALIDSTPALDWLLLTKRPENVRRMWPVIHDARPIFPGMPGPLGQPQPCVIPNARRDNVWIGTSISDQETADNWTPGLAFLGDLAPVRFLSAEPLVGPIDFSMGSDGTGGSALNFAGVNLVIVGGESGPGARPCSVEWVRDIVRQCAEANVACFVKQLGSNAGPFICLTDPKGGNPDEWPEDLRVRQMPERI